MMLEGQVTTASQCAGNLVMALTGGSHDDIRQAFAAARFIAAESSDDTLEEEYRALLSGIVSTMPDESNKAVVVRLLRHVASNAPRGFQPLPVYSYRATPQVYN
ncbi:MAG TPA: hypothetical protein VKU01_09685 [Bryobacteraceae bacterium]|nr:hypothetical protein [Bryobacteraceae bacterium]